MLQSGGGGGGSDSLGTWSEGFKAKSGDRRVYCHISQTGPQTSYLTLFLGSKVPFPHPTLGSKKKKKSETTLCKITERSGAHLLNIFTLPYLS